MITKIKRIFKKIFPHQKIQEQKLEIRDLKNEIITLQQKIMEIKKSYISRIKRIDFNFKQSEEARESLIERIKELNKELIDAKTKDFPSSELNEEIQENDDDKKGSGKDHKVVTYNKDDFSYEEIILQMDYNKKTNIQYQIYSPKTGITIGTHSIKQKNEYVS